MPQVADICPHRLQALTLLGLLLFNWTYLTLRKAILKLLKKKTSYVRIIGEIDIYNKPYFILENPVGLYHSRQMLKFIC